MVNKWSPGVPAELNNDISSSSNSGTMEQKNQHQKNPIEWIHLGKQLTSLATIP